MIGYHWEYQLRNFQNEGIFGLPDTHEYFLYMHGSLRNGIDYHSATMHPRAVPRDIRHQAGASIYVDGISGEDFDYITNPRSEWAIISHFVHDGEDVTIYGEVCTIKRVQFYPNGTFIGWSVYDIIAELHSAKPFAVPLHTAGGILANRPTDQYLCYEHNWAGLRNGMAEYSGWMPVCMGAHNQNGYTPTGSRRPSNQRIGLGFPSEAEYTRTATSVVKNTLVRNYVGFPHGYDYQSGGAPANGIGSLIYPMILAGQRAASPSNLSATLFSRTYTYTEKTTNASAPSTANADPYYYDEIGTPYPMSILAFHTGSNRLNQIEWSHSFIVTVSIPLPNPPNFLLSSVSYVRSRTAFDSTRTTVKDFDPWITFRAPPHYDTPTTDNQMIQGGYIPDP